MSFKRNPRILRIVDAMKTETDSTTVKEIPKNISMDELNLISNQETTSSLNSFQSPSHDVTPDRTSPSVSQAPVFDNSTIGLSNSGSPSKRKRTISNSSSLSSSSTSSSSSSSTSSSSDTGSGKDFSPDDEVIDPDYVLPTPPTIIPFNDLDLPENVHQADNNLVTRRRRKGNISTKQEAKRLRNSGQAYTTVSKLHKPLQKRQMGPPCGPKCRLQCSQKISDDVRQYIFDDFWKMGELARQRDYLAKCIEVLKPKYQYKVHNNTRGPKHSFTFEVYDSKYRVCKLFYKVTEMCYSDFYDIKNVAEACGGRFTHNTLGEPIKFSDIKIIKFEKEAESQQVSIYYKTSYTDTEFKEVRFTTHARSSRTRNSNLNLQNHLQNFDLKQLNTSRLPLSERKNKDLKSLINSNIIPQNYAVSYYNNILN